MSTRFARKRRKASRRTEAETTVATTTAEPASGVLEEFLFKAYSFVADNDRVRGYVLWIWSDGKRVYAVTNDRYLSNALYHALRALGRNRVRRWSEGGKWIIAYS
ncbi:MAG: hypothetical protein ACO2PM_23395 [Pyrobaculum sp.]|jgi:hypothetical protein